MAVSGEALPAWSSSPGPHFPSTTIVLGPFGDILDYGNGTFYLSWYPSGLQGSSSEIEVPEWLLDPATGRRGPDPERDNLVACPRSSRDLATCSAGALSKAELQGGLIFAWGATDIDDPASELHDRHAIGPKSVGRYHTIDTGKLTTAPLYARMVGEQDPAPFDDASGDDRRPCVPGRGASRPRPSSRYRPRPWTIGRLSVSIDGPDPACERMCGGFLDDPRFEVSIRPRRLGWARNIEWLQQQADGEFWYYHQQDDLVDPTYLECTDRDRDEARPKQRWSSPTSTLWHP